MTELLTDAAIVDQVWARGLVGDILDRFQAGELAAVVGQRYDVLQAFTEAQLRAEWERRGHHKPPEARHWSEVVTSEEMIEVLRRRGDLYTMPHLTGIHPEAGPDRVDNLEAQVDDLDYRLHAAGTAIEGLAETVGRLRAVIEGPLEEVPGHHVPVVDELKGLKDEVYEYVHPRIRRVEDRVNALEPPARASRCLSMVQPAGCAGTIQCSKDSDHDGLHTCTNAIDVGGDVSW